MRHRRTIAFSSEVDTGSHRNQVYADCVDLSAVETASKQKQSLIQGSNSAISSDGEAVTASPTTLTRRAPGSGQLNRLGLVVLAERVEYLGHDALGVEAGVGIHRIRRVVVDELVGQDHRAHL